MSLVGSLEDLGLGDILQIISLSRKSGILYLTGKSPQAPLSGGTGVQKRGARVVFKNGQVINASISDSRKRLGEIFVEKKLVTTTQVREALRTISDSQTPIRLDQALTKWFGVDPEGLENAIHAYLEEILFGLFDWETGDFNFDLKEDDGSLDEFLGDPQEPVLEGGLNSQFLAMEGVRRKDERGKLVKEGIQAPSLPPVVREPSPPAGPAMDAIVSRTVVIVDDDPATLSNLERIVTDMGYTARPAGGVGDAIEAVESITSSSEVPVLVIDLVMPKQDGKGMLGGLELLEQVKKKAPASPAIVITDIVDEDTERKVMEMGGRAYLPKPRRSQVSRSLITPAIREFGEKLGSILSEIYSSAPAYAGDHGPAPSAAEIGEEISRPVPPEAVPEEAAPATGEIPQVPPQEAGENLNGLAEELKSLEGLVDFLPTEIPRPPSSPGLQMLKSMIDELISPRSHSDITLLILRFASELMNRAVLFLVKREEVCGLGQFGIVLEDDNPERRVRAMKIPIDVPSLFSDVLDQKVPIRKKPEETPWNSYIFDQFGGHRPREVFMAPVFSGGRIVTILYGDNAPDNTEIGDTTSLEIFLAQAGLALDRALLERKLKDLKAKDIEWLGD